MLSWNFDKLSIQPVTPTSSVSHYVWIRLVDGRKFLAKYDFRQHMWFPLYQFYGNTSPFIITDESVVSWCHCRPPIHPYDKFAKDLVREVPRNVEDTIHFLTEV